MFKTLSECKAAGIPVFRFGSDELTALHAANLAQPEFAGMRGEGWRFVGDAWVPVRTYAVYRQVYADCAEGRQYVVDHGRHFTLNTLHAGQVCPQMQDIAAH